MASSLEARFKQKLLEGARRINILNQRCSTESIWLKPDFVWQIHFQIAARCTQSSRLRF
jgi:hypothetical protein